MDTFSLFGSTLHYTRLRRSRQLWRAVNSPEVVRVASGHRVRLATAGPLAPLHQAHKVWTSYIVDQWTRVLNLQPSTPHYEHALRVLYQLCILTYCCLNQRFPASPDEFSCYDELVYEHDDVICQLQQAAQLMKLQPSTTTQCQQDSCVISHRALFLRHSIQPTTTHHDTTSTSTSPCVTPTLSFTSFTSTTPSSPFTIDDESTSFQLPPPIMHQLQRPMLKTYKGMLYLGRGLSGLLNSFKDHQSVTTTTFQEDEECDVEQLL